MSTPTPESIDFLERRALAFCLAGRLSAWPDAALAGQAQTLAQGLGDGDELERRLAALALTSNRAAMESAYVELFENGPQRSPIHETEYGRMRGLSKGNDLADVEGFYHAFGLTRLDGGEAMADHLGVELEFYGTLLAKLAAAQEREDAEGVWVVGNAAAKFLEEHLGRFASAVALQPAVVAHPQYGPLMAVAAELVASECQRLELTPQPLDYFAGTAPEGDALCCGATVSPAAAPVAKG